jgi:hypothetical protein
MSTYHWALLDLANMVFLTGVLWWLDDVYRPHRERRRGRSG